MKPSTDHSVARTLAAVVGTAPAALALGLALATALPLPVGWRLLVGAHAVVPLWVGLMCGTFLAPDGRRAWGRVGAVLLVAALVTAAPLALGRGGAP